MEGRGRRADIGRVEGGEIDLGCICTALIGSFTEQGRSMSTMILQHPLVFESIDRYEVCCASLQHFSIVRAFESGSVEQAWLCEGVVRDSRHKGFVGVSPMYLYLWALCPCSLSFSVSLGCASGDLTKPAR
jgi:hypothetical protein